jgi:hypothetical protein
MITLAAALQHANTTVETLHSKATAGLPVGVVEDHRVRGLQVDAQASRAGGQHEHELVAAFAVEVGDAVLTVLQHVQIAHMMK